MALYLKQDQKRSQLSSKVAADLAHRLNKRSSGDLNDDSKAAVLLKDQRTTTNGGLFWSIIIAIVLVAAGVYVLFIF